MPASRFFFSWVDEEGTRHLYLSVPKAERVKHESVVSPAVQAYRRINGIKCSPRQSQVIAGYVARWGEEAVLKVIRECDLQIAAADKPLQYLGGILRNNGHGHKKPLALSMWPDERDESGPRTPEEQAALDGLEAMRGG